MNKELEELRDYYQGRADAQCRFARLAVDLEGVLKANKAADICERKVRALNQALKNEAELEKLKDDYCDLSYLLDRRNEEIDEFKKWLESEMNRYERLYNYYLKCYDIRLEDRFGIAANECIAKYDALKLMSRKLNDENTFDKETILSVVRSAIGTQKCFEEDKKKEEADVDFIPTISINDRKKGDIIVTMYDVYQSYTQRQEDKDSGKVDSFVCYNEIPHKIFGVKKEDGKPLRKIEEVQPTEAPDNPAVSVFYDIGTDTLTKLLRDGQEIVKKNCSKTSKLEKIEAKYNELFSEDERAAGLDIWFYKKYFKIKEEK